MNHRPEIDGLRAVAVLPVILYHAGFEIFSGGFVGVDVFFVLSGYLITSIILDDLVRGRFSVTRFLERRARRLLPALLSVLAVSAVFALLWLPPRHLIGFGTSVLSVLGFVSNFYFWKTVDYFGTTPDYLPLIHTWSLAVEEQFYIVFPLFMAGLFALGWGARRLALSLGIIAAISFGLCLWAAANSPSANFFFPVTRAWELLAGSLLALYVSRAGLPKDNDLLAFAGLALVCWAIFALDNTTSFPSAYALAPVGGTLLVLAYGHGSSLAARLLSLRGPVIIGLISYGAYLWHQPVFAFARVRLAAEPPSEFLMLVLSVLSLLIAYGSWRLLETPVRRGTGWAQGRARGLLAGAVVMIAVLGGTGWMMRDSAGLPQRYTPEQQAILTNETFFEDLLEDYGYRRCFADGRQTLSYLTGNGCLDAATGRPFVLYGNSHAAHLVFGLHDLVETPGLGEVLMFVGASCRPWIDKGTSRRCAEMHRYFLEKMEMMPPARVLVAANWHAPYWELGDGVFENHMRSLTQELIAMGHEVVLVGRVPAFHSWILQFSFESAMPNDFSAPSLNISAVNTLLSDIAESTGALFFDPSKVLCPEELKNCPVLENGQRLYSDGTHLSAIGSRRAIGAMLEKLPLSGTP